MQTKSYRFGDFHLDPADCTLRRGADPVALTPKAFDTLLLLVENRGRLMEKEVLMKRLWPDAFVEEANLANNISLLRKVLGEQMIQTVPRRGYRFVAEVAQLPVAGRQLAGIGNRQLATAAAVAIAAFALGYAARPRTAPPRFTQLTFRRGMIWSARFAPDAQTVIYSGKYEGKPTELFVGRVDETATRPIGVNAQVLAVSKKGDLALMLQPRENGFISRGTLARMPIAGGAPRELAADVQEADWMPDGERLALLRWSGPTARVEFPLGRIVYTANPPVWISGLRVSPNGNEIAFLLHEAERFDDRGRAVILDANGKTVVTSREFVSANGLAWRGDELVISAADGLDNAVYAIDRRGRERAIARTAGRLVLEDAAASGALLVEREDARCGIIVKPAGETAERELSWLDASWVRDVSRDGRTILFDEEGNGGGSTARLFLRTVDGAPPIDLGAGHADALSPDGKWALARQRFTHPPRLVLVPTGAGQARVLRTANVAAADGAEWLPDGQRILFIGAEPGRKRRDWLIDVASGAMRPVTPEGVVSLVTDGTTIVAKQMFRPLDGSAPRPVPFLRPGDFPIRFDGATLDVVAGDDDVERIDLGTGARTVVFRPGAARPRETVYRSTPIVSADGRSYAYTYFSVTSDLHLLEGAR